MGESPLAGAPRHIRLLSSSVTLCFFSCASNWCSGWDAPQPNMSDSIVAKNGGRNPSGPLAPLPRFPPSLSAFDEDERSRAVDLSPWQCTEECIHMANVEGLTDRVTGIGSVRQRRVLLLTTTTASAPGAPL